MKHRDLEREIAEAELLKTCETMPKYMIRALLIFITALNEYRAGKQDLPGKALNQERFIQSILHANW